MMEFIKIPNEFNELKELDFTERGLLAIYKYWTEKGKEHCCTMNNSTIYEDWLNVSKNTFHRMKNHLMELGYIKVDGTFVRYKGVPNLGLGSVKMTLKQCQNDTQQCQNDTQQCQNDTQKVSKLVPIKNNKEKERIIKEELKKESATSGPSGPGPSNFDRVIELLPTDLKTPDKIEYINNTWRDKIDNINSISATDITDDFISNLSVDIRNSLRSTFPTERKIVPVITKKDSIDMF